MKPVSVIGMGVSPDDLTNNHVKIISNADIVIGGKRHVNNLDNAAVLKKGVIKKEITADIKGLINFIKEFSDINKDIVVLASGDPLFFGIGVTLIKNFGKDSVNIYPNVTSVGRAFSIIKEPWHDVFVLSLHGKDKPEDFASSLQNREKVSSCIFLQNSIVTGLFFSIIWSIIWCMRSARSG